MRLGKPKSAIREKECSSVVPVSVSKLIMVIDHDKFGHKMVMILFSINETGVTIIL